MPKQKLEIECPVCDAKLSIDARSCPKCGADLGMADFQDLEKLANDISGGSVVFETAQVKEETVEKEPDTVTSGEAPASAGKVEPEPQKDAPITETEITTSKEAKEEKAVEEEDTETGKKKGLFSKFFGKKK